MRARNPHSRWNWSAPNVRSLVCAAVMAMMVPGALAVSGGGPVAKAAFDPSGTDVYVDSSMGPIKSRVFRAEDGNTDRVVYALDGMRAQQDLNGWEINTNIAQKLTAANINVVMPVGGEASFYTDWRQPSSFFGLNAASAPVKGPNGKPVAGPPEPGKSYAYKWETFLTRDLPNALHDRLGLAATRNGVFGLSMGGSAALTLAAYHPQQFSYAGSMSGFLNLGAPGMRNAVRVAMLDAGGYNIDCLASAFDAAWRRINPLLFAPQLQRENIHMFISAGSGLPTAADGPNGNTANGIALEALSLINTRAFQVRMNSLHANNVAYDFPAFGIHEWSNWETEVDRMLPDLSANIG